MKKNKLQHSTLKLNKGRIADLQSGTIYGGRDQAVKSKETNYNCIATVTCTTTLSTVYTTSNIACPSRVTIDTL